MATRVSTLTELTAAAAAGGDMLAIEDGNDAKYITLDSIRTPVPHGNIVVTTDNGTSTVYTCTADGATDDEATITTAFATAIADMPATVEFGPGDYGISDGFNILVAKGDRGLTIKGAGANATRISFAGGAEISSTWVAILIQPSTSDPTVGDYANYLHDITVQDIGFYDSNPVAHAGASGEETHAVKIRYTMNATIQNCLIDSIGDEGVELSFCSNGKIINNTTINTPSLGAAAAINIAFSNGIMVQGNTLQGSSLAGTVSTVTGSGGIALENLASTPDDDMEHIVIDGNNIRDFENIGIVLNNTDTGTNISYVTISNNAIDNCAEGIAADGTGVKKFINITGNVITNVTDGIDTNQALTGITDTLISGNTIDTCTGRGMLLGGTRNTVADNNISNTSLGAIFMVTTSIDTHISGGIIENCGATSTAVIQAQADLKNVTIDGVKILNSNNSSTAQVILACERVLNTVISGGTCSYRIIDSVHEVKNCTLNGGIVIDGVPNYGPSIIMGNHIDCGGSDPGTTLLALAAANDNAIIMGNYMDSTNGVTRSCITAASGSDNHVIVGNITVCDTAASGIIDSGTGSQVANNQEL